MTLLEFAQGPALEWSLIIFFIGVLIRVMGASLLLRNKVLSKSRGHNSKLAGYKTIVTRMVAAPPFRKRIPFQIYTGYIWHIGFAVTLLLLPVHILFFKQVLGISWPGLPNGIILITAIITATVLIALLIRRMINPVLVKISNFDDYLSLLLTLAPIITGIMAYAHLGPRYETMLAIHLLSISALLIWFPFGKLIHTFLIFPARYLVGAKFKYRGVDA